MIYVGQEPLSTRVAREMVRVHRIPRELADYHVEQMELGYMVWKFRQYLGLTPEVIAHPEAGKER